MICRLARRLAGVLLLLSVAPLAVADDGVSILDPAPAFGSVWRAQTFPLIPATEYSFDRIDGRPAIRAVGRRSASGLTREIAIDLAAFPWLEWSWRVENAPTRAALADKAADDFAAGVILLFGDARRDVPALAYVWTGGRDPPGSVIASPRRPAFSRHLVLRGAADGLGQWRGERRDVAADYAQVFGHPPPGPVRAVVLFTDNDQTGEAAEAHYGAIRALPR